MARPEKHDEPTEERAALYAALDTLMALVAADNCNYQRDTIWNELVWKVFDAGVKYGASALREENARKQAYIDKLEGRIRLIKGEL